MRKFALEFFNWRTMYLYFSQYNYLDSKYSVLCSGCDKDVKPLIMRAFCDYEINKMHIVYNKLDYKKFKDKFNMIYNDDDASRNMVFYYDFAMSELIDRFLNIDTLNKIFNDHYIEFEWLQHVELNFEKMDLKFYRDHFIHQIRNCYMIMRLLDGFDKDKQDTTLMDKIKNVLKSRGTELSKYAYSYVQKYKEYICQTVNAVLLDKTENKSLTDYFKVSGKNKDDLKKCIFNNVDAFAWEYFIRGSFIIASLFHDIGYPIQYVKNCLSTLNDFIPSILPQDNFSFDRLNDLLGSSLLFTIVEKSELEGYYKDSNHGAMSAFVLLMHFYETGTIHALNPIKRAMVEFAALMIFDHTFDYYKDGKTKTKPSFAKNPLSYTLRFVDDLQEWDRVYFEIRQNSDLRYCESCKMPIGRKWNKDIETKLYDEYKQNFNNPSFNSFMNDVFTDSRMKRQYICGCHNGNPRLLGNNHFTSNNYENGSLFPYSKINYSIICDNVIVIGEELGNVDKDSPLKLDFYIDYDPFRELYLLMLDNKALDYRMKELSKLNKQFEWQHDVRFWMIAYMTNNPIMLKLRVLLHFIYELGNSLKNDELQDIPENYGKKYHVNITYKNLFEDIKPLQKYINGFIGVCQDINLLKYNDLDLGEIDLTQMKICLKKCVNFFMNTNDSETQYLTNLKNLMDCYLSFIDYAKQTKTKIYNFSAKEYAEKGMINCVNSLDFVATDGRIKWATEFLIQDVFRQMYFLSRDGNMDKYWGEACDNKKTYKDLLGMAVEIFMEDKYYEPNKIQQKIVNNNKFSFIDLKSDLYLFKEMYRFSRNNCDRRNKAFVDYQLE